MVDASTAPSVDDLLANISAAREKGDVDGVAHIYRKLVKGFPERKDLAVQAAEELQALGRWSDAVVILKTALEHTPLSSGLLNRLANAYTSVGNYADAVVYLQRIADIAPDIGANWFYLGRAQAAKGDWPAAQESFGRAATLRPHSVRAQLGYGDALYQNGQQNEALAVYRRVATANADNAEALFKLGSALLAVGDHEESERLLRRSIDIDPSIASAHVNLAANIHYRGEFTAAAEQCRVALKLDPKLPVAHYTLGLALADLGQIAEAAAAFQQAVEHDPKSIKGLLALGNAKMQLGDVAAADLALQRILILEPGHVEARHLLAALHGEPVTAAPEGYAEKLFDWFAGRFDKHLVGVLGYRTPQDVANFLRELDPTRASFKRLLDIGCGTGLVAAALEEAFRIPEKIGVDISKKMLDVAASKNLYGQVIHGDIVNDPQGADGPFDLATAIDMLPYLGDLGRFMPAISKRLAPGGLFVYSIETLPEGSFKLTPAGRFAHSVAYVEDSARAAGLMPVASRVVILRSEKGKPVMGAIGALERPA